MGFSQGDWLELQRLQGKLDTIRCGPRAFKPPPVQLSMFPSPPKPKRERSARAKKPEAGPGYERYQLRLW